MAGEFSGRVRLVNEDFGDSQLAERFGVTRYPAVFVDDVLIAKPKDFGFFGTSGSQGAGRYTPWRSTDSHARFAADLERIVRRALRGELEGTEGDARAETEEAAPLQRLPQFNLEDLHGQVWDSEQLSETVTIVEFWATWCPPCLVTIPWLSELQARHAGRLQVLGVAVESDEDHVRGLTDRMEIEFPVAIGSPELAGDFGDLTAVPTLFVFDRGGRLVRTFFGAPPSLHEDLEALVTELLSGGRERDR